MAGVMHQMFNIHTYTKFKKDQKLLTTQAKPFLDSGINKFENKTKKWLDKLTKSFLLFKKTHTGVYIYS
jgi:hypothetical protein